MGKGAEERKGERTEEIETRGGGRGDIGETDAGSGRGDRDREVS
jgi:hypothetical protein